MAGQRIEDDEVKDITYQDEEGNYYLFKVELQPLPAEGATAGQDDAGDQEEAPVVKGSIHPWSGEEPVAGRQLVLCRFAGDDEDFVTACELMDEIATTSDEGRFAFYEEVPEGTYIVLYDTGDEDFEAAVEKWGGQILDTEWFDYYTDQLSDSEWVTIRQPPTEDMFFEWPEGMDIKLYLRTTFMIEGFPFIVAHDIDAMIEEGDIKIVLADVTGEDTEELTFNVLYFGD